MVYTYKSAPGTNHYSAMRAKFLSHGNKKEPLNGYELTPDWHLTIQVKHPKH